MVLWFYNHSSTILHRICRYLASNTSVSGCHFHHPWINTRISICYGWNLACIHPIHMHMYHNDNNITTKYVLPCSSHLPNRNAAKEPQTIKFYIVAIYPHFNTFVRSYHFTFHIITVVCGKIIHWISNLSMGENRIHLKRSMEDVLEGHKKVC